MTRIAKPPVVLLHALPLDSSMWRTQAAALRARGHPVIAPDQRGFGAVPLGGAGPSLDVVADDLAGYLDERAVGDVVLAGCSMGGYVAMAFLRRHGSRVRGLALLATRGTADTPQAAAEREAFAGLVLDDAQRGQIIGRTTPLLLGATTRARRPDTVARVMAMATGAAPQSVAWAQRAIAARPDSTQILRATDIPAMVVAGDEDELVSVDEARSLAEALPRGRLAIVGRAGHLLPLEAPARITQILVSLLDESTTAEQKREGAC